MNRLFLFFCFVFMRISGVRYLGLWAFFCGMTSVLSLAPFHLFFVLFVTLPLFVFFLTKTTNWRRAFILGFLFGFGYFLGGLWWVGSAFLVEADKFAWLLPVPLLGLPFVLSIFFGLGALLTWLAWSFQPIGSWTRILVFASFMTLAEFLRGTILSGFPWNLFGYALMPFPVMMQTSGLIGTYGMTFFSFFVFSLPVLFVPFSRLRLLLVPLTILIFFVSHIGYGLYALRDDTTYVPDISLRLVQPNIDQRQKRVPGSARLVLDSYLALSNIDNDASSFTHILWPESAFPFLVAREPVALSSIDSLLDGNILLTGALHLDDESTAPRPPLYNSLLAFDDSGTIIAHSPKRWLVPLGEFLPFRDFFEMIGLSAITETHGDFAAAASREAVVLPNTPPFLTAICYEIIYPGDDWTGRADWIVNLTNDAWFGRTIGPYQHAHQARIRGIELGLPVVRVANTGISFVTDSVGRYVGYLPLGVRDVLDAELPVYRRTFFGDIGNPPIIVIVLVLLFGVLCYDRFRSF